MRTCAVVDCKNNGSHYFPKDEELKQKWIKATRIDVHRKIGWNLRKYSSICSEHFTFEDFIFRGRQRTLKKTAVPTVFSWNPIALSTLPKEGSPPADPFQVTFNPAHAIKNYSRSEPKIAFVEEYSFLEPQAEADNESEADPIQIDVNYDQYDIIPDLEQEVMLQNKEHASPSIQSNLKDNLKDPPECQCESKVSDKPFSVYKYKDNDSAIHYFTGLETYQKLIYVYSTLGDCSNLKYFYDAKPTKLEGFEQFFLTLKILRRHLEFEYLGMLYNISIKDVTNIFITWIRFMTKKWKRLDLRVNRECETSYMSIEINEYRKNRASLDCTESPIKKPGLPLAQQETFFSYENPIKFLIGIAPMGFITYVSPAYSSSVTDKQLIERCDVFHKSNSNDVIMTDKHLNVHDISLPYEVQDKGKQFSSNSLMKACKVASKTVQVEKIIGLLKTYEILKQPLNHTEITLSSNIVFVCAMLVNFRYEIVNKCS